MTFNRASSPPLSLYAYNGSSIGVFIAFRYDYIWVIIYGCLQGSADTRDMEDV